MHTAWKRDWCIVRAVEMFSYFKIAVQTVNIVQDSAKGPIQHHTKPAATLFILKAQVNKSKLYRLLVPL